MSKKTKKEKIIADLRRKVNLNEPQRSSSNFNPLPSTFTYAEPEKKLNNEFSNEAASAQSKSLYIYPVQLIKKDLTKTIFLCILAISLELALYFLSKLGKI